MRYLLLVVAVALAACAQKPDPASPRGSRSSSRPAAAAASQRAVDPQTDARRLPATPAQLRRYEQAIARDLQDPRSARFSSTYLIERDGHKSLCGFVSEKNSDGRYTARKRFYASITDIDPGASEAFVAAPPQIEPRVSRAAIDGECRVGR